MRNKKLKKLDKSLEKLYYNVNKQTLYVASPYLFNKKDDFRTDIYATLKDGNILHKQSIYLFEIMTLNCFEHVEIIPHEHNFRKCKFVGTQNYADIAHTPLYLNRVFTLKKFGNITKKDIEGCVKYFMDKVLDAHWFWNVIAIIEYEKKKKKRSKLCK